MITAILNQFHIKNVFGVSFVPMTALMKQVDPSKWASRAHIYVF